MGLAGGPNDLYDIAILVRLHPQWESRVVALASVRGSTLRSAFWLCCATPASVLR